VSSAELKAPRDEPKGRQRSVDGSVSTARENWIWPTFRGRFLVIVATPELFGSCDGSRSAGSGTTDDEA
jgi:hypothetical protein